MNAPRSSDETPTERTVLFYACSGGANVAEAADRACRQLADEGRGSMFCLAGIAAGIEEMIATARDADLNVVIDGCGLGCARGVFDKAGVKNYVHIEVTDLDIEKAKGKRASDEEVNVVIGRVRDTLARTGGNTA